MDEAPEEPPAADGLLTQKQFAEQRGWSKQYVNQLVKQGKIPLTNGLIDPAAADAALARNRDPSRQGRFRTDAMHQETEDNESSVPAGAPKSFVRARTVRENYRALREKAEYGLMIGELVNYREVQAAAQDAGVATRDCIMALAPDIATAIAIELKVDEAAVRRIVQPLLQNALIKAADLLEQQVADIQRSNPHYQAEAGARRMSD